MSKRTALLATAVVFVVVVAIALVATLRDPEPEPGTEEAAIAAAEVLGSAYDTYAEREGFRPVTLRRGAAQIGVDLPYGNEIGPFESDGIETWEFCIIHPETGAWALFRRGYPTLAAAKIHGLDGRVVGSGPSGKKCVEDPTLPVTKHDVDNGDYEWSP